MLQNRICIPELLPARIEGTLEVPWSIQPILAHLPHGGPLQIIAAPDTISIVKHARLVKTHMSITRKTTLNASRRVNLILMPPRHLILRPTFRHAAGVERHDAFIVRGRQ